MNLKLIIYVSFKFIITNEKKFKVNIYNKILAISKNRLLFKIFTQYSGISVKKKKKPIAIASQRFC